MSKKSGVKVEGAPGNGAIRIKSLDELQGMVDAPVVARFQLDGRVIEVECRRLTGAVEEQVRKLRRESQPPYLQDRKDYDYANVNYLAARELKERQARSFIVYAGCPAVAAKQPGLTDPGKIHEFVKGILSEQILELLSLTIVAGGLSVEERTNFTSAAGLAS